MIKDLTAVAPNAAGLLNEGEGELMTIGNEMIKQAESLQRRRALCQPTKQKPCTISSRLKVGRFK